MLRSLINEIQNETYTGKTGVRYGVRIFLGALAGLIIGIIPKRTTELSTLPPAVKAGNSTEEQPKEP